MNRLTIQAFEMSGKHAINARQSRKAAMNRAKGYKRISQRPEERGQEERWQALIDKAVKCARQNHRLVLSAKQFSKSSLTPIKR